MSKKKMENPKQFSFNATQISEQNTAEQSRAERSMRRVEKNEFNFHEK
jgi:hypothetical protein